MTRAIEKEEKTHDSLLAGTNSMVSDDTPEKHAKVRKGPGLTLVKALIGDCLCQGAFPFAENRGGHAAQFVTLHGIEFIGLGAVIDELTPKERVYDTLEQSKNGTERLISIGYLSLGDTRTISSPDHTSDSEILLETVPLDVWNKTYPNDQAMPKRAKRIISNIKANNFRAAISDYRDDLKNQTSQPNKGNNRLLAGITAHNLGVLFVLAGLEDQAIPLFEDAIDRKRSEFGPDHAEVAVSLDELGIQYFARSMFVESLTAFEEARRIRVKQIGGTCNHPKVAMVLNNIACCKFQMKKYDEAIAALLEARDILSNATGLSATDDLDLLHMAITHCNYAYLLVRAKQYEEARSIFEEALLIQQSVLGDDHRAIRDTLSNIEFTNAFHSY